MKDIELKHVSVEKEAAARNCKEMETLLNEKALYFRYRPEIGSLYV